MSVTGKGKKHSEQTKERMSKSQTIAWKDGKRTMDNIVCPHCGREGKSLIMNRWHFDKCKVKVNLQ